MLDLEAIGPFHPLDEHVLLRFSGDTQEVQRVPVSQVLSFTDLAETLEGELSDGLQHNEPSAVGDVVLTHHDEAVVNQRFHPLEQVARRRAIGRAHGARGLEGPSAREDPQRPKEGPGFFCKQPIAPRDRVAKGLLSGRPVPRTALEQCQCVFQPRGDVRWGEETGLGGGELDRERETIEPRADLSHRLRIARTNGESRPHVPSPLFEERDALVG